MSENSAPIQQPLTKEQIEERLAKTEILANTYQAAMINKMLMGTRFKVDLVENVKKKVNSSAKSKRKKPSQTSKPPDYLMGAGTALSDSGQNTPGSFNSGTNYNNDPLQADSELSLGRRTSRREKKPKLKVDLGYEEPKPIRGVKMSGAAKEIFKKCEESLNALKEEFLKVPEFANKANKLDQELKKLRDGHYQNTALLGNSVRKFLLNNLVTQGNSSPLMTAKVEQFVNRFEESFHTLDGKALYEESKYDLSVQRKKSTGMFKNKKGPLGLGKKPGKKGGRGSQDIDRPMTNEEKKVLSRNIRNLTAPQLKGVIKIVRDMFPEKNGMLEFDIDTLPPHK